MQPEEKDSFSPQLDALLAEIRQIPSDEELHWKCGQLLKDLATRNALGTYQPAICELLLILFSGNAVAHQTLALMSVQQLKLKYQIGAETNPDEEQALLLLLARDGLFLAALEKTLNTDHEFEGFLRKLRRYLLFECCADTSLAFGPLRLTAALAQQGLNNEYIWIEEE